MWVIWRALQLRLEQPGLFCRGDYQPLTIQGQRERHVVAFARTHENAALVAVAGRMYVGLQLDAETAPLGDVWADTTIALPALPASERWRDVLSGQVFDAGAEPLPLTRLLAILPVALLVREAPPA